MQKFIDQFEPYPLVTLLNLKSAIPFSGQDSNIAQDPQSESIAKVGIGRIRGAVTRNRNVKEVARRLDDTVSTRYQYQRPQPEEPGADSQLCGASSRHKGGNEGASANGSANIHYMVYQRQATWKEYLIDIIADGLVASTRFEMLDNGRLRPQCQLKVVLVDCFHNLGFFTKEKLLLGKQFRKQVRKKVAASLSVSTKGPDLAATAERVAKLGSSELDALVYETISQGIIRFKPENKFSSGSHFEIDSLASVIQLVRNLPSYLYHTHNTVTTMDPSNAAGPAQDYSSNTPKRRLDTSYAYLVIVDTLSLLTLQDKLTRDAIQHTISKTREQEKRNKESIVGEEGQKFADVSLETGSANLLTESNVSNGDPGTDADLYPSSPTSALVLMLFRELSRLSKTLSLDGNVAVLAGAFGRRVEGLDIVRLDKLNNGVYKSFVNVYPDNKMLGTFGEVNNKKVKGRRNRDNADRPSGQSASYGSIEAAHTRDQEHLGERSAVADSRRDHNDGTVHINPRFTRLVQQHCSEELIEAATLDMVDSVIILKSRQR